MRGDKFAVTLNDRSYTNRTDGAAALRGILHPFIADPRIERGTSRIIGTFGGLELQAPFTVTSTATPTVQIKLIDVDLSSMTLSPTEIA